MSSFRGAQVLGAISQNLGLYAERAGEKERRESDRAWDLKLEEIRAQRQGEAEQRAIDRETGREERSIEREGVREAAATERYNTQSASAERRHGENLSANTEANRLEDVRRREESLTKLTTSYDEAQADAIENMGIEVEDRDAESARIIGHFDQLRSTAIQAHVAQLASKGLPGYEAETMEDIRGLLMQNRYPTDEVDKASSYIYEQLTAPQDLFPPPQPGSPADSPMFIGDQGAGGAGGGVEGQPPWMAGIDYGGQNTAPGGDARPIDMVKPTTPANPAQALSPWVHDAGKFLSQYPGKLSETPAQQSGGGGR